MPTRFLAQVLVLTSYSSHELTDAQSMTDNRYMRSLCLVRSTPDIRHDNIVYRAFRAFLQVIQALTIRKFALAVVEHRVDSARVQLLACEGLALDAHGPLFTLRVAERLLAHIQVDDKARFGFWLRSKDGFGGRVRAFEWRGVDRGEMCV